MTDIFIVDFLLEDQTIAKQNIDLHVNEIPHK